MAHHKLNAVPPFDGQDAVRAVLKVGGGRGFIMETKTRIPRNDGPELHGRRLNTFLKSRIIVTAAHCLPCLPPAHPGSVSSERTYPLLGPLGGTEPSIMAECLFADPIADVAVLGIPDGQSFEDADTAFEELVEGPAPLRLGNICKARQDGSCR